MTWPPRTVIRKSSGLRTLESALYRSGLGPVAGVDEVYAIGGAQAIGAMAYGTETIRPVDVIAGPGNMYVAIAKREVAGVVGVPSAFAGPSEIVVVADETTLPTFAAIDVMVQAEHGLAYVFISHDLSVGAAERRLMEIIVSESNRLSKILEEFLRFVRPQERRVALFDPVIRVSGARCYRRTCPGWAHPSGP